MVLKILYLYCFLFALVTSIGYGLLTVATYSVPVSLIFCVYSGDAMDLRNWPKQIEIKGRVRLDALEKFLQEIRQSRTRAVMVS